MKKGLKKKLGLSIATLGLTVASLSTTTYAWWTQNSVVKTGQLDMSAQTDGGSLFISADGETFGSAVSFAALSGSNSIELKPVTYIGAVAGVGDAAGTPASYKFLTGDNAPDKVTGAATQNNDTEITLTGVKGAYVEFSLFFKTTQKGNIYFKVAESDGTSFATLAEPSEFTLLAGYGSNGPATTNKKTVTKSILEAGRLAVTVDDTRTVYVSETDATATADTAASAKTEAEKNAVATTDKSATNNLGDKVVPTNLQTGTENPAWNYYKALMGYNTTANYYNSASTDASVKPITNYTVITTTNAPNDVVAAKFTFFVEGWDADCIDAIMDQTIQMNLAFRFEPSAN